MSARLVEALREALEFAEDQEDVVDGPDGAPQANSAMLLAQTIRAALAEAEAQPAPRTSGFVQVINPPQPAGLKWEDTPAAPLVACKGRNCGSTDGRFHSRECYAEHDAACGTAPLLATEQLRNIFAEHDNLTLRSHWPAIESMFRAIEAEVRAALRPAPVAELVEAATEVLRISDRKHDAWDRLKAALARAGERA